MGKDLRNRRLTHGTITGYTTHGCRCEPCAEAGARWREKRKARYAAKPKPPMLPVEPILAILDDYNRREITLVLKRSMARGISVYRADRICCKLGVHPWMVYGDLYFQDLWKQEEAC